MAKPPIREERVQLRREGDKTKLVDNRFECRQVVGICGGRESKTFHGLLD